MATTSDVSVANGTADHHVATWTITEDAKTKDIQRVGLVSSSGAEIDFTATSPVTQSGTWTVGISASQTLGLAAGNAIVGQVKPAGRAYETVAASQTDQAMGATGATGDVLDGLLIVPGTTAAGAVSIKDGAGSSITVFAGGGTTALTTLIPFFVPIGATSAAGAWKVTTGSNVTVIGFGSFT